MGCSTRPSSMEKTEGSFSMTDSRFGAESETKRFHPFPDRLFPNQSVVCIDVLMCDDGINCAGI
jgi:hypothetical protein